VSQAGSAVDLLPQDVGVTVAEDGPRLIDFGISRSVEAIALTSTGTVVGSPGFMSPEQAEGREVGPPSDIFSLGAVLTFAATGEGPFGEGSTVALLYRVVCSQPDVALLDIEMPGMDGLSAAAELKKNRPGTKIVILTTFGRPGFLRRAMESGVSGFLVKDSPADKLTQTIRRVLAGERVIDPDLAAAALADGLNPLTPRERDVLEASAGGGTIAEIARHLYLSEGTVRNYLSACIQKTGARNRAEALRIASERGWL
jgi:two-component system response regulator DesR